MSRGNHNRTPGSAASVKVEAPAKVNLFLKVLGTRPDGFHDIESLVCPVSLCDSVELENREDGRLQIDVSFGELPGRERLESIPMEDNLAFKAAEFLKNTACCEQGVNIRLHKRIPVGGGLGGGSSDAAAVLTGLKVLWNLEISRHELEGIGSVLGCDVPALMRGGLVLAEGAGEKVRNLHEETGKSRIEGRLVLANPGFPVSTRDVYSRFNGGLTARGAEGNMSVLSLAKKSFKEAACCLYNDLQEVVFKKYPLIEILAANMKKAGAMGVLLSGSGATVFGLADDEEHAKCVEKDLVNASEFPVWTRVVEALPDGVMVAHGPLEARV